MLKKYAQHGVTFYYDDDLTCVDIDVDPDVTSVAFTLGPLVALTTVFHLRDVKKQFPNVTELSICRDVAELHISNYMFPNVRHVKSDNVRYLDETQFLIRTGNASSYKLENAFCLKTDETLNLSEIDEIGDYKIGNYALEGCYAQDVDFGDTVFLTVKFDTKAFDGSGYMQKPYENGIKTFANYIIDIDKDLKELTIPKTIIDALETVDFSTLDKITFSNVAFMYVASENPTFPKTVRFESDTHLEPIVKKIFSNKNFENFEIPETNPAFYTDNGILYSKDKETLILYPKGRAGDFMIPDEVSKIQTGAFARSSVGAITFPSSLKNVEKFAFTNCGVTQLTIMPGELKSFGGYEGKCFTQCKRLTTVDIAGTVRSIGPQVFAYCSSLSRVRLHEGIQHIDYKAFFNCDALIEIELPSSLQYVGDMAFDRVERVVLNDNIPKRFIQAIICPTVDIISDRYKDEKKVVEIIIKAGSGIAKNSKFLSEYFAHHPEEQTYTLFIPKYMGPTKIRVLSAKFDRFAKGDYANNDDEFFEYVNSLFSLTSNILSKQMTAFAVFERYRDATAATYLKRCAKNFAIRLIERNDADSFVRFLGSGLCSRASLKTLCPIASTNENPVFSAYLMKAINESKAKQAAFQI